MIFTFIKLRNLYCFSDTEVDLTFPVLNPESQIPDEYLAERPKFKFKKICILSSANAAGKTSFGKALCGIQNFLVKHVLSPHLTKGICDKSKKSGFYVEFVLPDSLFLCGAEIEFDDLGISSMQLAKVYIAKTTSSFKARKDLLKIIADKHINPSTTKRAYFHWNRDQLAQDSEQIIPVSSAIQEALSKHLASSDGYAWNYIFANTNDTSSPIRFDADANLLAKILKSFDNSISSVSEVKKEDDSTIGFVINFYNGDAIQIDKDKPSGGNDRLSKGTYESITLAGFITWILNTHGSATFFLDEQLAYCHTEIEIGIINLIIEKLERHSQFFYTTHNSDVLAMNLPVHTFSFLKKVGNFTEIITPNGSQIKNDRPLLNEVRNNTFGTIPDLAQIDELTFS